MSVAIATTLKATFRPELGSTANNRVRSTGQVPGIIYGPGIETVPVTVNLHDFKIFYRHLRTIAPIFDLTLVNAAGATETRRVALRAIQTNPVTDQPSHLDFYQFDANRKLSISVPVTLEGTPEGIALGGVLQWTARSLRISSRPEAVPTTIVIDVSTMKVGESLAVGDVRSRFNFDILEESGKGIAQVIALRKARVAAAGGE